MGLREKLKSIFKGEDKERINGMLKVLKEIKVFTEEDLIHLDREILEATDFFKNIEIKKLLFAKPDAKGIREKLDEIFVNVNPAKITAMEEYFTENEVYIAEDLAIYSLEKLANEKSIFSDLDVNKIKNYIRKEFPDKFAEIGKIEDGNRVKDAIMFEVEMKKKVLQEERKSRDLEALHRTKEQLLTERHAIQVKLADLMISQTENQGSSKQPSGLKTLPAINQKMDPKIAGGVAATLVIGELVTSGLDIYNNVSRNANNESNKKILEEKLQTVNNNLFRVDKSIDDHFDEQARLTSSSAILAIDDKPK